MTCLRIITLYDKKNNSFREVIGIQMATVRISVRDLLSDAWYPTLHV